MIKKIKAQMKKLLLILIVPLLFLSAVFAGNGVKIESPAPPPLPPPVNIDTPQPQDIPTAQATFPFIRGDANTDGNIDKLDLMTIYNYINYNQALNCEDATDVNDDGQINRNDIYSFLSWLFFNTSPIPEPFPEIAHDPTEDALGCESYPPYNSE